jgi:CRISPR-associated protein Cmr2
MTTRTKQDDIWRAKAAAWVHDPGEKQLILFARAHEGGTVKRLQDLLLGGEDSSLKDVRKMADHFSSAADRPQLPKDADARVIFRNEPVLIHPLSGIIFSLRQLGDVDLDDIEKKSFAAAQELTETAAGKVLPETADELRRALLALWRFLPDKARAPEGLGELWRLLPADSRTPDHSTWTHLDLASALAGAMAADANGEVALLMVALGPVQDFIAQARSTSDLWAGSHLLSALAFAAMRPVIEALGPDTVIFPHLRGVPQVDLWLIEQGLPETLFSDCEWNKNNREQHKKDTDYNPLFMAALPNLFVAIVPRDKAQELAHAAQKAAREKMADIAAETLGLLLEDADDKVQGDTNIATEQINEQLKDFPEVYWAAIPWGGKAEDFEAARNRLEDILRQFSPADDQHPGIFGTEAFEALLEGFEAGEFVYKPNAGVLYPAAHAAIGRGMGAVKSLRAFEQTRQEGFRCSLCGEREWLTLNREQLHWTRRQRDENSKKNAHTLWTAISRPAWAKKGEHLCAICASKRLWPTIFTNHLDSLIKDKSFQRYVVSTHALALADDLMDIIDEEERRQQFAKACQQHDDLFKDADQAALPRQLAKALREHKLDEDLRRRLRQVPAVIEARRASEDRAEREELEAFLQKAGLAGHEKYYAVLLMDGDSMGAWLSGENGIRYLDTFHPHIRRRAEDAARDNPALQQYLQARRLPSPSLHVSMSAALNGFAMDLVRAVVEELCNGKLIYAGGDDVLAMLTVEDALKAAMALRFLYGGHMPPDWKESWLPEDFSKNFQVQNGFVRYRGQLYMTMGPLATASAGLVIAHAMTPLSRVLGEARRAEKQAKNAGRNALAITVMKRAGNIATAVGRWPQFEVRDGQVRAGDLADTFPGLLAELSDLIGEGKLSRRAPYHIFQRIEKLPPRKLSGLAEEDWNKMLSSLLAFQFERQAQNGEGKKQARALAARIAAWACAAKGDPLVTLREFLGVAEFLGRRRRKDKNEDKGGENTGSSEEKVA